MISTASAAFSSDAFTVTSAAQSTDSLITSSSTATNNNEWVLSVCEGIAAKRPILPLPTTYPPAKDWMKQKYLRSSTELQHFLCSLHVVDKETSVLLIDGFERFFADQSHMGNVYQTLAYLLEAQDYMKTATGSGVAVVAGNTDAFLLRDRPLLRRWCRFLEIVSDEEKPGVFTLREEVENAVDVGEDVARTQVRYEFSLPVDEEGGNFQLLLVQTRSE
ncbi:hypothetical protein PRIC2_004329 [Phytophthora ramorum]